MSAGGSKNSNLPWKLIYCQAIRETHPSRVTCSVSCLVFLLIFNQTAVCDSFFGYLGVKFRLKTKNPGVFDLDFTYLKLIAPDLHQDLGNPTLIKGKFFCHIQIRAPFGSGALILSPKQALNHSLILYLIVPAVPRLPLPPFPRLPFPLLRVLPQGLLLPTPEAL